MRMEKAASKQPGKCILGCVYRFIIVLSAMSRHAL